MAAPDVRFTRTPDHVLRDRKSAVDGPPPFSMQSRETRNLPPSVDESPARSIPAEAIRAPAENSGRTERDRDGRSGNGLALPLPRSVDQISRNASGATGTALHRNVKDVPKPSGQQAGAVTAIADKSSAASRVLEAYIRAAPPPPSLPEAHPTDESRTSQSLSYSWEPNAYTVHRVHLDSHVEAALAGGEHGESRSLEDRSLVSRIADSESVDLGFLALYPDVLPAAPAASAEAVMDDGPVDHSVFQIVHDPDPECIRNPFDQDREDVAPARDVSEAERPKSVRREPSSRGRDHGPAGCFSPEFSASFELPCLDFLGEPEVSQTPAPSEEVLEEIAGHLEKVIRDFGVKGDVVHVRPGPVVTLYELEPAPGTKSSRVISLADDIARSMSAVSARVAVVQGRNAIGIELPNHKRETVFLRELLASQDFETTKQKLALCLGKTIGGEPVIADLARMPHLLVAGTTGSGKSVAINTMILSLVYRLKPEECRLIMVDPKMLELSVYDGIPHLLTPVVTDPKKAVVALKWAVREMEDRYKKMSKLGVRNIDGFNARVGEAKAKGEVITRTVQTGFDKATGEAVYEDELMDLEPLPYIVVIVDEMADLMMVAGKDIEGAIQRLAQMARAAGIHVILATQRPSVDVITGTIKANFPTRISFQVTSKIDSRTILGEMGAEQLLGQGDMLYMAGGGRITRVHGPFCSDEEVEKVVAHLKRQGRPQYLEAVTADEDEGGGAGEGPVFDQGEFGSGSGDLYDQAVAVVLRDKKASTSYIQRRLQIGYNRAASLMERMEKEGIVGPANHAGKRDILIGPEGMDAD